MSVEKRPLFDPPIVKRAIRDSFTKLHPRTMVRNPVMFVVFIGSILTSLVLVQDLVQPGSRPYDEVRGDIAKTLYNTRLKQGVEDYAAKLRALSKVAIHLEETK